MLSAPWAARPLPSALRSASDPRYTGDDGVDHASADVPELPALSEDQRRDLKRGRRVQMQDRDGSTGRGCAVVEVDAGSVGGGSALGLLRRRGSPGNRPNSAAWEPCRGERAGLGAGRHHRRRYLS